MKVFAATLVAMLATSTAAANSPSPTPLLAAGYPQCSWPCLNNMAERTGCASYDLACFCKPEKRDIQTKCIVNTSCSDVERTTIRNLNTRACATISGAQDHAHNPAVPGHNQDAHNHTHSHDQPHGTPDSSRAKDEKVIISAIPKNGTAPKNGTVPNNSIISKNGETSNKTATAPSPISSPNPKTDSSLASISNMPSLALIGLLGGAAIVVAL